MLVKVSPSPVKGVLQAPASKSCTQRALAAALLKPGVSIIENPGHSNDELVALGIIQSLGAKVERERTTFVVTSERSIFKSDRPDKSLIIDCGESGLSVRMFASVAALFDFDIVLHGEGSILTRPMDFIDKYLPRVGVDVKSTKGKIPITIRGPLKPKNITVNGALSSQFLTGLLFAFCGATLKPVTITVEDLTSRPYIDLTISVLKAFGFRVENNDYRSFDVLPVSRALHKLVRYKVEGDWSNAAFLLVAGAVGGHISLKGMSMDSVQGDRAILNALYKCNADVELEKGSINVTHSKDLKAFDFDATQCPDLFPPLVALAAYCKGTSRIQGVHRLLHKESNRAIALRDEFGKMNVEIEINGDEMRVTGAKKITGAKIYSHNDHRIAMAATVASLGGHGVTEISGAEAVNKSYPGFYDDMKRVGVALQRKATGS